MLFQGFWRQSSNKVNSFSSEHEALPLYRRDRDQDLADSISSDTVLTSTRRFSYPLQDDVLDCSSTLMYMEKVCDNVTNIILTTLLTKFLNMFSY